MINSFSIKLWWNFRIGNSLWAKFMHGKYVKNKHASECQRMSNRSDTWRRHMNIKDTTEEHIMWFLVKGSVTSCV